VAIAIIVIVMVGDLVPLLGDFATLPIAIIIYYVQGILTAYFIQSDQRYAQRKTWNYLRFGALSAIWTGLILSNLITLVDWVIFAPVFFGVILLELPLTLITAIIDLILNLLFTTLGAWIASRTSGFKLAGISCAILAASFLSACGLAGAAIYYLIRYGSQIIHIPHL
jgi:hypothetical protein